jgi:transporter family-2 protein
MNQAIYLFAAFLIGVGGATQTAMLGSISKDRGSFEAAWISMIGTAVGLAVLLLVRGLRDEVDLPAPLDRTEVWVGVIVLTALLLTLSMRGIAPGFAIVGLFGLAFVVGAAILIPEIGVSGFVVGATAGTLLAGLALDHSGSFGADVRPITLVRSLGVGLALVGAFLVRADG